MSSNKDYDVLLKVVFTGESMAGKTSLLNRITEDTFSENHFATIGVDFKIKTY
jgi:GTPase SAR1 family protein